MKIILTGGGTIGSVSTLIAVFEEIKKRNPQVEFLWIGTRKGPEKKLISSYGIPMKEVFSGKLRRYFSFHNFFDPFLITLGIFQSIKIILKFKPNVILSAGGYVAFPVSFAGAFLGKTIMIHQQDIKLTLTNKILIPFAKIITVAFSSSLKDFPKEKTKLVGNPVRADILTGESTRGYELFGFDSSLPVVLILGGGTGAEKLNQIVILSLEKLLVFCQVIHLTGGKIEKTAKHPRYKSFDFLTGDLKHAYAIADLVVTRAGMSTLTEIAALQKPAIIIPMPDSHQEDNANQFFKDNAAAVVNQKNLTPDSFVLAVKTLLEDKDEMENFKRNIPKIIQTNAAKEIADMIL